VREGPVCRARTLSPCYCIPGAEVDTLVYPDINHIVSHIREAVICDSSIDRVARDREDHFVSEGTLERPGHRARNIVRTRRVLGLGWRSE
jgi:hypothetical protein